MKIYLVRGLDTRDGVLGGFGSVWGSSFWKSNNRTFETLINYFNRLFIHRTGHLSCRRRRHSHRRQRHRRLQKKLNKKFWQKNFDFEFRVGLLPRRSLTVFCLLTFHRFCISVVISHFITLTSDSEMQSWLKFSIQTLSTKKMICPYLDFRLFSRFAAAWSLPM